MRKCKFSRSYHGDWAWKEVCQTQPKSSEKVSKIPKKLFWCAHTVKIVGNFVQIKFWGISGQKVLIKTIFFNFWDFCAIFWSFLTYLLWRPISVVRTAEFAIFRLNVVILVIIQWNKPEKGRVQKSVPEKCKSSQTFTLKIFKGICKLGTIWFGHHPASDVELV